MDDILYYEFLVYREDFINAGKASSQIKKYLNQLGIDALLIRRIAITSYEAEINLVIHSLGGKLNLYLEENKVTLISEDNGPGILDVEKAMTPGFSTASAKAREMGFGAGMGLPNMKKNADEFYIESSTDGTLIKMVYYIK